MIHQQANTGTFNGGLNEPKTSGGTLESSWLPVAMLGTLTPPLFSSRILHACLGFGVFGVCDASPGAPAGSVAADQVTEFRRSLRGRLGDPNSSPTHTRARFHPCITNHRREPSSNRRRSSRQHSAYSVAAALLIFIAPPGGGGALGTIA